MMKKRLNKKAQELSAHFGLEWFIQNIVLIILLLVLLSFGLWRLISWLTG